MQLFRQFAIVILLTTKSWSVVYASNETMFAADQQLFYAGLSSWVLLPEVEQIDSLKSFVKNHPDYYPAFLKLHERFLKFGRVNGIKKHFQHFRVGWPHYKNAQWMLALYYAYQQQPDRANACFQKAVSEPEPPYALLFDYLAFDSQNSGAYSAFASLETTMLAAEQFDILAAYQKYLAFQYQQAAELYEKKAPYADPVVNRKYCEALYYSGDFNRLMQAAKTSFASAQKSHDLFHQAYFLLSCIKYGAHVAGVEPARASLDSLQFLIDKIDNLEMASSLKSYQGFLARQKGHQDEAIAWYTEAANGYRQLYDWKHAAQVFYEIAYAQYIDQKKSLALQAASESLFCLEKSPDVTLATSNCLLYGLIYRDLGLYEMADKYLNRALDCSRRGAAAFVAEAVDKSIRHLHARQATAEDAIVIYEKLLQEGLERSNLHKTDYDALWFTSIWLAMRWQNLGNLEEAYAVWSRGLEYANKTQNAEYIARSQTALAELELKKGKPAAGLRLFEQALQTAERDTIFYIIAQCHLAMGQYYQEKNNLDAAIEHYALTVVANEKSRQDHRAAELAIAFLADKQEAYERLSECYWKKYRADKDDRFLSSIFYYEEMMHARALKDQALLEHSNDNLDERLRQNYAAVCQNYRNVQLRLREAPANTAPAVLDSLLSTLEVYKNDIINERIQLEHAAKKDTTTFRLPGMADIQRRLNRQTALLYHVTDRAAYALVLQKERALIVPLAITRARMDSLVTTLMEPFHHITKDNVKTTPFLAGLAFELFIELFLPIEQNCALDSQIFIIPTGSLAHLPFDILLDKQPAQSSYTPAENPNYAANFLAHRYAFFYGPSTAILLRPPLPNTSSMLIVANPFTGKDKVSPDVTYRERTGWRFDPLIHALAEAKAVRKFVKKATLMDEDDANESAFANAGRYSIVHVATHAFIDTTYDAFSGLALAVDKKRQNDGLLMGYEIADLDFACNLVTLSACETGRGKQINGEGVLGLPWQFLARGARSLIMSGWKVDDEFTASFMPRFYQNYLQSGLAKVTALQRAKTSVLVNGGKTHDMYQQHPFFWAAFNLYGDSGAGEILMPEKPSSRIFNVTFIAGGITALGFLLIWFLWKKKSKTGRYKIYDL